MGDLLPAVVTAGVGLVLLVAFVLAVRGPARRFSREVGSLRAELDRGTAQLRALRNQRRG